MANFSVVATPIGNMEDITLRALKALASADLVLCEDTRVTKKLLDRHNIKTKTLSYHAHSTISRTEEIVEMLKQDKNICLVSDAGTPGISDPGSELIRRIREEMKQEIENGDLKIESIPGPSALTAALSIAGIPCADFIFLGFLPHKKGRETLFQEMVNTDRTVIFFESPHRILKTLESLESHTKDVPKKIVICREITKIFEEVVAGSATEVKDYFNLHKDKVKGEFVVIVSKSKGYPHSSLISQ